jgi:hypothetical protein
MQSKELHLADANLEEIEPSAFDSFKKSLEILNLGKNKLRTLNAQILDGMSSLYDIDLSQNAWLCDDKLLKGFFKFIEGFIYCVYSVVNAVQKMYQAARNVSTDFELRNEALTICSRPYSWQNKTIFDLPEGSAKPYDERLDTTAG